jgi:hypothetical protein
VNSGEKMVLFVEDSLTEALEGIEPMSCRLGFITIRLSCDKIR